MNGKNCFAIVIVGAEGQQVTHQFPTKQAYERVCAQINAAPDLYTKKVQSRQHAWFTARAGAF